MATYSQTTSGLNSTLFEVDELYVLNDAQAQAGNIAAAQQTNLAFLVQGPDGAQGFSDRRRAIDTGTAANSEGNVPLSP